MTPKSGKLVPLHLDTLDLGQTIDALDTRAEAYERTAEYLDKRGDADDLGWGDGGESAGDDFFIIEEVRDADEARAIAEHFREIQESLNKQWAEWREQQPK